MGLVCGGIVQLADELDEGNAGKTTVAALVIFSSVFLAVRNSSIGDLVTDSLTHSLTQLQYFTN